MAGPLSRTIPVALALSLACAKGAQRPNAPVDTLHYPAWLATFGDRLLVVNLDQDLAYEHGAVVSVSTAGHGSLLGGVPLPNMAGKLLVVGDAGGCSYAEGLGPPFALVAGRFEQTLVRVGLDGSATGLAGTSAIDLRPFSASAPDDVGLSCGPDGVPRAWVSFGLGRDQVGYLSQVDLGKPDHPVVEVRVGLGAPRALAYDAARDRLYLTSQEAGNRAPLRWIDVGSGCVASDDGTQDPRTSGCHVDDGYDLGARLRGAEGNDLALSSAEFPCTAGGFTGSCRRAYLSVRMYDADVASFTGERPSGDVGGKLLVLELPEGGQGRPEPQWIGAFDIGLGAGDVHVIPRPGRPDLVAVTAVDDHLLWIYDDQLGAMVKVFGRDSASGVPELGHHPAGIASQDLGNDVVRLFVASYQDNWVSAVDVPLDDPASAAVVPDWRVAGASP